MVRPEEYQHTLRRFNRYAVLIDTPPAAILPDCNLLAPSVDGALLIVDAFNTPHPMAVKAIEAVGREKILGVVFNHAEHNPSNYKYGKSY